MATSSKVRFKLETLKVEALKSLDFRIGQLEQDLTRYNDPSVLETQIAEWRTAQEAKISKIFHELGPGAGIDNYSLSRFKLDAIPEQDDKWERRRTEQALLDLRARRSQVAAKSDALVPDEDGNIALTKTQLDEFFDL